VTGDIPEGQHSSAGAGGPVHPVGGGTDLDRIREVVLGELAGVFKRIPAAITSTETRAQNKNLSSLARKSGAVEFKGTVGTSEYDAEFWLVKLRRVCTELGFTQEELVRCAVALLQDEAYQWWTSVTSHLETEVLTWEFFKNNFEAKYIGPAYFEKKRREFMNLQQGSMTPQEYEREFVRLSSYAPELVPTEAIRCQRFVYGLEMELQLAVVVFKDTVFSTLRERVFSFAEVRSRAKGTGE
jgi:hypothetical protein